MVLRWRRAVRREGIGGIPSRYGLLSWRWQRQVRRAYRHIRTQGELPAWLCRIPELGGSPVADSHNSRALSPVLTANLVSALCNVLKRTTSDGERRYGSLSRLLPCRQPPPPRAPSPPTQAQDGDVRAGSTVTGREVAGPGCQPTRRLWSVGRGGP